MTHKQENINTKKQKSSPTVVNVLAPHQASQPGDLTLGLGIPRESGLEGQWDLIIGLPQDWGKQRLQSWRAQTKFCAHQDSEERSSDPVETEPKPPASVGGPPVEAWVSRGSSWEWGHWQQQSWKWTLGISPPGGCH